MVGVDEKRNASEKGHASNGLFKPGTTSHSAISSPAAKRGRGRLVELFFSGEFWGVSQ